MKKKRSKGGLGARFGAHIMVTGPILTMIVIWKAQFSYADSLWYWIDNALFIKKNFQFVVVIFYADTNLIYRCSPIGRCEDCGNSNHTGSLLKERLCEVAAVTQDLTWMWHFPLCDATVRSHRVRVLPLVTNNTNIAGRSRQPTPVAAPEIGRHFLRENRTRP